MFRHALPLVLMFAIAACSKDSPTSPTGPPAATETRIISVTGNLAFGVVEVGSFAERTARITNSGNSPLTVTGMTGPSGFAASWTSGVIPAGAGQDITVRFTPPDNRDYAGSLVVNGNHTSGNNRIDINGTGARTGPLWEVAGSGPNVFDMPAHVTRVRITGQYSGRCENFAVRVGGSLVVNVILGTCSVADFVNYEGTHLVKGGVTEVIYAAGVNWRITEVR